MKQRKKIIRLLILICIVGMLIGVAALLIDAYAREQEDQIYYYPAHMFATPDFSFDILSDEDYLGLDRSIYYTKDNITAPIKGDESEIAAFWCAYFSAILHGDADAYNGLFSEFYLSRKDKQQNFTMQRIYNIQVEFYDAKPDPEDEKQIVQIYIISYRIAQNNGTFRRDILSDMEGAQALYLIEENGKIKIDQVIRLY